MKRSFSSSLHFRGQSSPFLPLILSLLPLLTPVTLTSLTAPLLKQPFGLRPKPKSLSSPESSSEEKEEAEEVEGENPKMEENNLEENSEEQPEEQKEHSISPPALPASIPLPLSPVMI